VAKPNLIAQLFPLSKKVANSLRCLPLPLCVSKYSGSGKGNAHAHKPPKTLTVEDKGITAINAAKVNHTAGTAQNTTAAELVA
jgi:hypothetical protein